MLDPGTKVSDGHFGPINTSYKSYGVINYQSWNRTWDSGAERKLMEDEDSGVSSPPLWRRSPPRSPQHRQNHYRSLSPASRTLAIARGQKELMEMVSRMPEGCFELSLKDIVEQSMVDQVQEESFIKERGTRINEDIHLKQKEKKKNDKKVKINRSRSIDNGGFLLKMVFPISFGSRKKKKTKTKTKTKNNDNSNSNNNSGMNNSGRVSPRPLLFDGSAKDGENEWWKKRFSEQEENESGGFSSNSGSSKSSGSSSSRCSSRNSSGRNGGGSCWSFIFRKRGKKKE